MDAIGQNIMTSVVELIKYSIIKHINTGDKTQDNLLIALLMVILTSLSGYILSGKLMKYFERPPTCTSLNKDDVKYINDYYMKNLDKLYTFTPSLFDMGDPADEDLDEGDEEADDYISSTSENKIRNLIAQICSIYFNTYAQAHLGFNGNKKLVTNQDESSILIRMKCSLSANNLYAVYADNGEFVFIRKHPTFDNLIMSDYQILVIYATSLNVFKKFLNSLSKQSRQVSSTILKIFNNGRQETLYADRTFDNYISKHKPRLLNILKNFVNKNTYKNCGSYGSYNLGIMLHGNPGTGKTLLMKVVANYLKRNIQIIDMRKIKTRQSFVSIFNDIPNNIYILDEIDCIKGIITNREEDAQSANTLRQLKDRYLQVLQMSSGENSISIAAELNNISKQIEDMENVLTLDTMLTVLDGVVEHRSRVIIAATNHIEKIDPALIRDGRFDIKLKLEEFDADETRQLLSVMFKTASKSELARLATAKLISGKYTPAALINMSTEAQTLTQILNILEQKKNK
jgi:AAA+ superfamily predicted ATPase